MMRSFHMQSETARTQAAHFSENLPLACRICVNLFCKNSGVKFYVQDNFGHLLFHIGTQKVGLICCNEG